MYSSIKFRLFVVFLLFFSNSHVKSQFLFQKIKDDPFAVPQSFEYWSNSRYNRVEGLFLHGGTKIKLIQSWNLSGLAEAGYGTKNDRGRFELGLQKQLGVLNRLILFTSVFQKTATNDDWMIGEVENSLAAAFLHEDFMDYYGRRGWRIFADKQMWDRHFFRLEFSEADYIDMKTSSNFAGSVFGGNKEYRQNPSIVKGKEQKLTFSWLFDWRDNSFSPTEGVLVQGSFAHDFSDFDANGLFFDATFYQTTFGNQLFILKSMFAFIDHSIAQQHLLNIGGVGSLRAFRDHLREGQNFALLSANYFFAGDIIKMLYLDRLPLLDAASFGLFFDIGDAWASQKQKDQLFAYLDEARWLYDSGISLALMEGLVRVDFARQLNPRENDWRITLRLFHRF